MANCLKMFQTKSRSASPEFSKLEEPGMFLLLNEQNKDFLLQKYQLRSRIVEIEPKTIDLSNAGTVVFLQEDSKSGGYELLRSKRCQFSSEFHVSKVKSTKLQAFQEVIRAASVLIILEENDSIKISSWRHFLISDKGYGLRKRKSKEKSLKTANAVNIPSKFGDV